MAWSVFLVVGLLSLSQCTNAQTPVVMWHGMGDSCCNPASMGRIQRLIEDSIPGVYVMSIQIGETFAEDTLSGFLRPISDQIARNGLGEVKVQSQIYKSVIEVQEACREIKADHNIPNGIFNAIGFSQGSQFLRALVQQCSGIHVNNLISIGGQHQGVYGTLCPADTQIGCDAIRQVLTTGAYLPFTQKHIVQAQYWHDPLDVEGYKSGNIWLPDINNENAINQEYKDRLVALNQFVMVRFNNDSVVVPVESQWFGFYVDGQRRRVQTLQESDLYKNDQLGLKQMDEEGRLVFIATDGDHLEFSNEWFVEEIIPYLE